MMIWLSEEEWKDFKAAGYISPSIDSFFFNIGFLRCVTKLSFFQMFS
jgi:hypothetical protein